MQQLVRIEPRVESITGPDGDGYSETFPNHNNYNLQKTYQFGDDRAANPLSGYNTEIWLIEGNSADIDRFISENASAATRLTPEEAKTLADSISPAKTITCIHCGGTGVMVRNAWTSPI